MAITKILNIKESEGRNPASHLKELRKRLLSRRRMLW